STGGRSACATTMSTTPVWSTSPPGPSSTSPTPTASPWRSSGTAPRPDPPGTRIVPHRGEVGARSAEAEAVEVHDLVPHGHEVAHERLVRVVGRVDLGDGPQLRVGAEHQVDGGGGPPELAGGPVAALVDVLALGRR